MTTDPTAYEQAMAMPVPILGSDPRKIEHIEADILFCHANGLEVTPRALNLLRTLVREAYAAGLRDGTQP